VHGHHHASAGAPVLDIGGEVGAIVVHLTDVPPGGELEACPADRLDRRFHTGVHLRTVGGRDEPVAVYPEVLEGEYDILGDDLRSLARVQVVGGVVTELHLAGR
jgi:hypothetical protein